MFSVFASGLIGPKRRLEQLNLTCGAPFYSLNFKI